MATYTMEILNHMPYRINDSSTRKLAGKVTNILPL